MRAVSTANGSPGTNAAATARLDGSHARPRNACIPLHAASTGAKHRARSSQ